MKFPPSHLQSQTSKHLSKLGFGGAALSGEGGGYGFGAMSEKRAEELLKYSWERGITLYDTAPIYGFGMSEERMGRYLPKEAFIVTKGGVGWHPNKRVNMSNDPKIIESMVFESLKRLQRDQIDVYMIHWPDAKVDIRAPLEVLEKFRKLGVINSIGLCNTTAEDLTKAESVTAISYLQSEFNLFNQTAFTALERKNRFCMGWGTFDKGILTGRVSAGRTFEKDDCRSWAPWWDRKVVEEKMRKVSSFQTILREHGSSLLEFNLLFGVHHFGLDCALVGPKSEEDLSSLLDIFEKPFPVEKLKLLSQEWEHMAL